MVYNFVIDSEDQLTGHRFFNFCREDFLERLLNPMFIVPLLQPEETYGGEDSIDISTDHLSLPKALVEDRSTNWIPCT